MKKLICLLLLAAMALSLTACEGALVSTGTTFMSVSSETSKSFRMSYRKFDGSKQYRMRTRKDNTTVRVEIETHSGTLDAEVVYVDDRDERVYSAQDLQTGSYTFIVPEKDNYIVILTADEHVGSYSFDWHD